MRILPRTPFRVSKSTAARVNEAIYDQLEQRVRDFAANPTDIQDRLDDLDREWDIERTLEANASIVALTGLVLGATVDRRFNALPAMVAGFLLMHAVQGWCPPVPIFRRMGVRTMREIDTERYALKALRGDFTRISDDGSVTDRARAAVRAAE
jgi:hypothetical protein